MKTSRHAESIASAVGTFIKPGWPPLLVFFLHLIALQVHIYAAIPEFDTVMHFLGGVTIAYFFHTLHLEACSRELVPRFYPVTHVILVLALTCTAAMFWEFGEFLSDRHFHSRHQAGLDDTMLDMFLGLVGGITLLILHPLTAPRRVHIRISGAPLNAK